MIRKQRGGNDEEKGENDRLCDGFVGMAFIVGIEKPSGILMGCNGNFTRGRSEMYPFSPTPVQYIHTL